MTFRAGVSGNPAGKPRGSKSKWTKLRESVAQHVPEILDQLVAQAKQGDTQAAKLLLERVLPPLRSVDAPVKVAASGSLSERGDAVIARMLGGQVSPSEGAAVLSALSSQARLVEADELTMRVEALEQATERRR